jgi:hypothetical protein
MDLRRLIFGTASVVDDRAQRVEIVTSAEMLAPLTPFQRLVLWRWLGPTLVLVLVVSFFVAPEVMIALMFMMWWVPPLVAFLLIGSRRRRLLALPRGALAAGLCGGCAYRIEEQHAEPDGKRVCPECGGAWIANAPPPPPAEAAAIFRRHYVLWYGRTMLGSPTIRDHRGGIMPRMTRVDPASVAELRSLQIRGLAGSHGSSPLSENRTRSGIALMVLAFFVFGFAVNFASDLSGTVLLGGLLLPVVLGLAGAWLVKGGSFELDHVAVLRAGLCPACTHPISGATPEVDGCAKCPSCWAAWRATDIGTTPSTLRREP